MLQVLLCVSTGLLADKGILSMIKGSKMWPLLSNGKKGIWRWIWKPRNLKTQEKIEKSQMCKYELMSRSKAMLKVWKVSHVLCLGLIQATVSCSRALKDLFRLRRSNLNFSMKSRWSDKQRRVKNERKGNWCWSQRKGEVLDALTQIECYPLPYLVAWYNGVLLQGWPGCPWEPPQILSILLCFAVSGQSAFLLACQALMLLWLQKMGGCPRAPQACSHTHEHRCPCSLP